VREGGESSDRGTRVSEGFAYVRGESDHEEAWMPSRRRHRQVIVLPDSHMAHSHCWTLLGTWQNRPNEGIVREMYVSTDYMVRVDALDEKSSLIVSGLERARPE
jgi:hypothetical protein